MKKKKKKPEIECTNMRSPQAAHVCAFDFLNKWLVLCCYLFIYIYIPFSFKGSFLQETKAPAAGSHSHGAAFFLRGHFSKEKTRMRQEATATGDIFLGNRVP